MVLKQFLKFVAFPWAFMRIEEDAGRQTADASRKKIRPPVRRNAGKPAENARPEQGQEAEQKTAEQCLEDEQARAENREEECSG